MITRSYLVILVQFVFSVLLSVSPQSLHDFEQNEGGGWSKYKGFIRALVNNLGKIGFGVWGVGGLIFNGNLLFYELQMVRTCIGGWGVSPTGKSFRFVSFARARGLSAYWNSSPKGRTDLFPFPFWLVELSPLPYV